jgi:hypothetical protein
LGTTYANALTTADSILTLDDDREVISDRIESIEKLTGEFTVIIYQIDAPTHVFISDNILSHNLRAKPGDEQGAV